MTAQQIRDFFSTLFGSRRVELLREELTEARKERDYFRARAERFELMLLTPREPKNIMPRNPNDKQPVGRKPWAQVMREDYERQMKEAAAENEARKAREALKGTN